jgi:suppressor for copper-sensitivity B
LRGDWTTKDEKILKFIKKYERFGVPVNIIYSRNMKNGLVLPEILSSSIVIDNFERIK